MTIQQELNQLPVSCHLYSKHTWQLCLITAQQAPKTVQLLQQLRTASFELEAYEALALYNSYDAYHHHLVLWDTEAQTLIGAYRLGFVQELIQQYGIDKICFLADDVFDLDTDFLNRYPGLIELSGVFIQPQYQRNYHSLLTLWKGLFLASQRLPCAVSFLGQIDFTPPPNDRVIACLENFFGQADFQLTAANIGTVPQGFQQNNRRLYLELVEALTASGFDCTHSSLIMLKHYLTFPIKCLAQARRTIFSPAYNVLMLSETMTSAAAERISRGFNP